MVLKNSAKNNNVSFIWRRRWWWWLLLYLFLLLYIYEHLACMCVCMYMHYTNYFWFQWRSEENVICSGIGVADGWATMWMLGTKPPARSASALSCWAIVLFLFREFSPLTSFEAPTESGSLIFTVKSGQIWSTVTSCLWVLLTSGQLVGLGWYCHRLMSLIQHVTCFALSFLRFLEHCGSGFLPCVCPTSHSPFLLFVSWKLVSSFWKEFRLWTLMLQYSYSLNLANMLSVSRVPKMYIHCALFFLSFSTGALPFHKYFLWCFRPDYSNNYLIQYDFTPTLRLNYILLSCELWWDKPVCQPSSRSSAWADSVLDSFFLQPTPEVIEFRELPIA